MGIPLFVIVAHHRRLSWLLFSVSVLSVRFDLVRFGWICFGPPFRIILQLFEYFFFLFFMSGLWAMLQHSLKETRAVPRMPNRFYPTKKEQTRFPQATEFCCCCRLMKTIFTMVCSPRKNNKNTGRWAESGGGGGGFECKSCNTAFRANNKNNALSRRC